MFTSWYCNFIIILINIDKQECVNNKDKVSQAMSKYNEGTNNNT